MRSLNKFAVSIFGISLFLGIAQADISNVHILPYCAARGPVYLEINKASVDGYIGLEEVHFKRDMGSIFGDIKGERVQLVVKRNSHVRGSIGTLDVDWQLNQIGNVIYGLQSCPPEFILH
jgi:hypothetical protein